MSLWTSAEIAAATGGKASADFTVSGVTFDSREVGPGDLFIALTGETTDGHSSSIRQPIAARRERSSASRPRIRM